MSRLFAAIRRLLSTTRGRVGAILVIGLLGSAIGIASLIAAGKPASTLPAISYSTTWTLADLVRHADGGEVLMIATGEDGTARAPSAPILAAKTGEGQWVRVDLVQTRVEAVAALRALGYGRLLSESATAEYLAAVTGGSAPPPSSGLTTGLIIVATVSLLGLIALALTRPGSAPVAGMRGSKGSTFETILPSPPAGDRSASRSPGDAPRAPAVTFADVAGCDEAKAELVEVVEFLRDPTRFGRLGARIPRGVLLYGPPGTGKTMLAKATAAEAGVAFTHASGSDFVEKFVGVGAQRIRALFAQARAAGRGVVFIDEIDALARTRGDGDRSHIEADQTLNALLTAMDGFGTTDEIIVLAATNRLDTLDPAILRPGRFTRKVSIALPDREARVAILAVHARNKPLDPAIDLETLARRTAEFSGAMLADLLNEAAIIAARRDDDQLRPADIEAGWTKVAIGVGRRRSMPLRERAIIGAHEAGHAICGRIHAEARTVRRISMFRHGDALGYTSTTPDDDELLPDESSLRAQLVALMGGRAAEALCFTEVTGGASNDFEKANRMAAAMVTHWGFGADPDAAGGVTGRGALGYLVPTEGNGFRGDAAAAATRAIRAILDDAYATAVTTLRANFDLLERVAAYLVEHEEMSGEEFAAICDGSLAPSPRALATWRVAEAKPRARAAINAGALTEPARRPVAVAAVPTPLPVRIIPVAHVPMTPDVPVVPGGPMRLPRRARVGVRSVLGAGLRGVAAIVEGRRGRDDELAA